MSSVNSIIVVNIKRTWTESSDASSLTTLVKDSNNDEDIGILDKTNVKTMMLFQLVPKIWLIRQALTDNLVNILENGCKIRIRRN